MNGNKSPVVEGKGPRKERWGDSVTPLGRSHQGGGEAGVVDPTIISLVLRFQSPEVYGRWFMSNYCNLFFLLFLCFFY